MIRMIRSAGQVQRGKGRRHGAQSARRRGAGLFAAGAVLAGCCGCEPYRIEYHQRPDYYAGWAAGGELPERIVLEDGTIVVYNHSDRERALSGGRAPSDSQPRSLRRTDADGRVRLIAETPEHVMGHTLACLQAEEYRLLWDELVAEETRLAYEHAGLGYEDFESFCRDNRIQLGRTVNRLLLGLRTYDTTWVVDGPITRYQLQPHFLADPKKRLLKFNHIEIIRQNMTLKLRSIY